MPLTTLFSTMLKGYVLYQTPFVISTWYVGLLTGTTGTLEDNEVTGTGYSRLQVQWNTNFQNANELKWESPEPWGNVTAMMLCTGVSGNNALIWQTTTQTNMTISVEFIINPGSLALTGFT